MDSGLRQNDAFLGQGAIGLRQNDAVVDVRNHTGV
jgi:hypothetical protein